MGTPASAPAKNAGWVCLKGNGYAHLEIVKLVRVDKDTDTVTDYVRKYRGGSLPELLAEPYRKKEGLLYAHEERLKEVFENSPPHTANQAIEVIELETGVRI